MRRMSFALTGQAMVDRTKTVTRRLGWAFLLPLPKPVRVMATSKVMGLKPGEVPFDFGPIDVVSVRREPLRAITPSDVVAEGFPAMNPLEFVGMFCEHMACGPDVEVTRLEFVHVDRAGRHAARCACGVEAFTLARRPCTDGTERSTCAACGAPWPTVREAWKRFNGRAVGGPQFVAFAGGAR